MPARVQILLSPFASRLNSQGDKEAKRSSNQTLNKMKKINKTKIEKSKSKISEFSISKTKIEKSKSKISEFSISKTKIEKRLRKKTDSNLVGALIKLKKTNPKVAKEFSKPKKLWKKINLSALNLDKKAVIVPGKVLSQGELKGKIKIVAWDASEKAKEKMKKAGSDFVLLVDELKKNPELKNLELIN